MPAISTIELPRMLLGERLTLLLTAAASLALAASLTLYPGAPLELGFVAATILLLWLWRTVTLRPRALRLGDAGAPMQAVGQAHARFAGTGWVPVTVGHETRCLGPSLVLYWQASGRSGMLWLTPRDVPRHVLRCWARHSTARVAAVR